MQMRRLGHTGLRVSTLALGTMTWGTDTDEHEAKELFTDFLASGGTLIDTAPGYGRGRAEELVGALLSDGIARTDVTIMTKAGVRADDAGRAVVDTSRRTLLDSLDESLAALGTDHTDIFVVQAPDPDTGVEEVAAALTTAVRSGRAHYVGVANYAAWQVAQLAGAMPLDVPLALAQAEYSLLQREAERELLPACRALGVGFVGCAPLGRGVLTGKYRNTIPADSRAASQHLASYVEPYLGPSFHGLVEAVATAAQGLDCQALQVAAAWAQAQDGVAAVISGPRTAAQLRALLGEVTLPPQIMHALSQAGAQTENYRSGRR